MPMLVIVFILLDEYPSKNHHWKTMNIELSPFRDRSHWPHMFVPFSPVLPGLVCMSTIASAQIPGASLLVIQLRRTCFKQLEKGSGIQRFFVPRDRCDLHAQLRASPATQLRSQIHLQSSLSCFFYLFIFLSIMATWFFLFPNVHN